MTIIDSLLGSGQFGDGLLGSSSSALERAAMQQASQQFAGNYFSSCTSAGLTAIRTQTITNEHLYKSPETFREELQRDTDRWLN